MWSRIKKLEAVPLSNDAIRFRIADISNNILETSNGGTESFTISIQHATG